jgi:DNA-binding transcriptional LysR family regulator
MDTRQLETLLAVADTGSFAAAASVVNLTPSAVSQQIQALETELGTQLFDRTRRPPSLNANGMELLQSARTIIQVVSETKRVLSGVQVSGTLNIGAIRTASMMLLPKALVEMRQAYPGLLFNWRVGLSETLMSDVVAGRLDVAIVAEHVGVPSGLIWTPFLTEPLQLIGPPDGRDKTYKQLLKTYAFIRYATNVPLSRQIDTEFSRMGITAREIAVINTIPAIISSVYAGLGIAVVPKTALLDPTASHLASFAFGSPPISRRLGIVRRKKSGRLGVIDRLTTTLSDISDRLGIAHAETI